MSVEKFKVSGETFTLKYQDEAFDSSNPAHKELWGTAIRDYWLKKARYSAMNIAEKRAQRTALLGQYEAAIKAASPKLSAEQARTQAEGLMKALQPDLYGLNEGAEFDFSTRKIR